MDTTDGTNIKGRKRKNEGSSFRATCKFFHVPTVIMVSRGSN